MARNNTSFGDWILVKDLGGGQFGKVTQWKNIHSNDMIAIKMCKALESQSSIHARQAMRWKQEIVQTKEINHANIVKYKEIPNCIKLGFVKEFQALGMEYCDGGDLRNLLSQIDNNCGLREYMFRDLMRDISDGLSHLHRNNIIHRDLKPENIVLKKDKDGNIIFKIIDLGYAKDISGQNHATSLVGTWHYIAPEFWEQQGKLYHSEKVDYWSFGLVTFECITGRRPFYPYVEPLRVTREIRDKKKDQHICTVYSIESGYKFSPSMPQPNWLHVDTVERFVPWLQSMLVLDPNKRGGEDWYRDLQNRLTETQIIYVFNSRECRLVEFSLGALRPRLPLKQRLLSLMSVQYDDQLICLFEQGHIPDPRLLIESQCADRIGPPRVLYVFTTEGPFDVKPVEIPKEVKEVAEHLRTQQGVNPLVIFSKIIFYVNEQFAQCNHTLMSLSTLNKSVKRLFVNCRDKGEKMTVSFNEFCGSLETIMMSQELEANSYANTSVEFALGENFASAKKEMEKFKHHELTSLKQMVDQITNPVPQLNDLLYKNDNFVDTNLERIEERKRSWRETARTFRAFSRQLRDLTDRNTTDINALTEEAYSKLHVLIKTTVTPLNHFAKNLLHKSITAIESLVKAHRTISSVLGGTDIRTIHDSIRAQKNRMLQQRREQHETLAGSVSVLNENLTKMYRYIHNCCSLYNDFINRYYTEIERLKTQNIDLDVTTLTGEMNKNLERMERTIEGVKHDWDDGTCKYDWSFLDDFDEDGVLRAS